MSCGNKFNRGKLRDVRIYPILTSVRLTPFNRFLYGGTNQHLGPDAVPYDEIFILTLPAFSWTKINYPPQLPRGGHSCNAVGGNQIVSVGGYDANPKIYIDATYDDVAFSTFNSSADPFTQGLGIFDMTRLAWADHFTANAPPYTQSDLIREYYRDKWVFLQTMNMVSRILD